MTTPVWPYVPQVNVVESLEWLTDVIRCRAKEYRHCLRANPREGWQYTHHMTPQQFATAKKFARDNTGASFYLPVWTEFAHVGAIAAHTVSLSIDGSHRSYNDGDLLLVWDSETDYETCLIGTVGVGTISLNPWVVAEYTDAYVMPIREVTFAQPFEADRTSISALTETSARFRAVDTLDLDEETGIVYADYRGYPLVTDPTELLSSSITEEFQREVDALDSGSGVLVQLPTYDAAIQTTRLAWTRLTRDDVWDLRVWLHARKGKWRAFWASSWGPDITVTDDIGAGSTVVEIADCDFATTFGTPSDFVIRQTNGLSFPFKVLSVEAGDPGKELLNTASPISVGGDVLVANIAKTSRLTFSRFDADRIEINHGVGGKATVAVPVIEVPYEEPPS